MLEYTFYKRVAMQLKCFSPWLFTNSFGPKLFSRYANLDIIAIRVLLYSYVKVSSLCPDSKTFCCSNIIGFQETIFHQQHDTKSNRDSGDTMCVAHAVQRDPKIFIPHRRKKNDIVEICKAVICSVGTVNVTAVNLTGRCGLWFSGCSSLRS